MSIPRAKVLISEEMIRQLVYSLSRLSGLLVETDFVVQLIKKIAEFRILWGRQLAHDVITWTVIPFDGFLYVLLLKGARGGAVVWSIALQAVWSRVPLEFYIDTIPPPSVHSTSNRNQYWECYVGVRCVGLTTFPHSCAYCLEFCKPQTRGNLRVCQGLYKDCFTLTTLEEHTSTHFLELSCINSFWVCLK